MDANMDDFEPTLDDDIMSWIWATYPELYDERKEHLNKVFDLIKNHLEMSTNEEFINIESHNKALRHMLESRFYFLLSDDED